MKTKQLLMLAFLLLVSLTPMVSAEIDLSETLSSDDEDAFDEILEPVMDIYNFLKYIATAVAALIMVGAGILFMMSGGDPGKREKAKNTLVYVVIGLVIIWIVPLVIDFLVQ
jgi:hypothetical protein